MVTLPPSGAQHEVKTWSKLFVSIIVLAFITVFTLSGVVLAEHITLLGIFLNVRAVLQYIFANLNNRRMTRATVRAILDGLYRMFPHIGADEKAILEKQLGQKHLHKFVEAVETLPRVQRRIQKETRFVFWRKLAYSTIATLKEKGFKISFPIDANVPIYRVTIEELTRVLKGIENQIYPFRVIWLVLNDPDNQPLREFLHEWVYLKQQEVHAEWEAGHIETETQYEFQLNRWRIIDLKEADKRGAMTAAWLSSFGVELDQLDAFVKQLFDHPDEQLSLKPPGCQISQNIDSDTVADEFSSFITYLSFVIFGLAGLTSNVRISNISEKIDFSEGWRRGFEKWFFSWSNYFKYDFANRVERAAQSFFWCVVCMSGPWMSVLTELIPSFLGRFVNYTLRGTRIKPGDDRKVTYELNRMKRRVGFHPWVITYTDAPDSAKRYCSIQDRWTLSMYANFTTSLLEGQIWLLHIWSIFDQLYAAGFTFLVMAVFGRLFLHSGYVAATVGVHAVPDVLLPYLIVFITINLIRGFYAVWDNEGDWKGMFNSIYFLLVMRYLIPIKLNRLLIKGITPAKFTWSGRGEQTGA